jgi:hypothetical protein
MADQISICNQALLMLGDTVIQSLTEDGKQALVANNFYLDSRDHVLRDIKPSFAIVRAPAPTQSLTLSELLPYTYALPDNCVVVLSVLFDKDPRANWIVEGLNVLSAQPLTQLVYIANDVGLERIFDSSFVKALVAYLASEFCYALTGSATKSIELLAVYESRKMECLAIYGMESATRVTYSDQLLVLR